MAYFAISGAALVFLSQSPPSGLCFLIFRCLPVGASQDGVWAGIDRLVRCPSNFEFCREGFFAFWIWCQSFFPATFCLMMNDSFTMFD